MLPLLANAAVAIPAYLAAAQSEWEDMAEVHVTIKMKHCGYDNAWYTPGARTVTVCDDLVAKPALLRFVFNHEMAHAYFHQRRVPVSDEELMADELAFWVTADADVADTARWFLEMGSDEDTADGHPADLTRAASLLCLLDGVDANPVNRQCVAYARSSRSHWLTTLDLAK